MPLGSTSHGERSKLRTPAPPNSLDTSFMGEGLGSRIYGLVLGIATCIVWPALTHRACLKGLVTYSASLHHAHGFRVQRLGFKASVWEPKLTAVCPCLCLAVLARRVVYFLPVCVFCPCRRGLICVCLLGGGFSSLLCILFTVCCFCMHAPQLRQSQVPRPTSVRLSPSLRRFIPRGFRFSLPHDCPLGSQQSGH